MTPRHWVISSPVTRRHIPEERNSRYKFKLYRIWSNPVIGALLLTDVRLTGSAQHCRNAAASPKQLTEFVFRGKQ
jgi:hypothetical protein